jgi:hypothetical protein
LGTYNFYVILQPYVKTEDNIKEHVKKKCVDMYMTQLHPFVMLFKFHFISESLRYILIVFSQAMHISRVLPLWDFKVKIFYANLHFLAIHINITTLCEQKKTFWRTEKRRSNIYARGTSTYQKKLQSSRNTQSHITMSLISPPMPYACEATCSNFGQNIGWRSSRDLLIL